MALTTREQARHARLLAEPNPTPEQLEELEYLAGKSASNTPPDSLRSPQNDDCLDVDMPAVLREQAI